MEKYTLRKITVTNIRPTAFQGLHRDLFPLVIDTDIANYADGRTP